MKGCFKSTHCSKLQFPSFGNESSQNGSQRVRYFTGFCLNIRPYRLTLKIIPLFKLLEWLQWTSFHFFLILSEGVSGPWSRLCVFRRRYPSKIKHFNALNDYQLLSTIATNFSTNSKLITTCSEYFLLIFDVCNNCMRKDKTNFL